ncbi:tetratricopeptide repeat protein [Acidithiobacillus caldus]|uniref:Cytochrome c-type biogenesis protein H TPR domain-containing protein n=1 Tax=Acidithiobacillus caldus TaxID=33059 RepID=A0A1E7YJN8_9PROT|nr:tetratricopeptide repeat protein [Acidithiobacillus caldus]OFC29661.1 hypothetical protein BAE27_13805 [Acidithiobacillus caldus]OFC30177.1 hypothetical protein BAE28_15075 [Acidithiobacillus caldus]OFC35600.1 hypothetical protein BAE29_15150 [Acidithiobacillus caldus]
MGKGWWTLTLGLALLLPLSGCAATPPPALGGETLYYLLTAEFATTQGVAEVALPAWQKAVELAPQANVLAAATKAATRFGDRSDALRWARLWRETAPDDPEAARFEAALLLAEGEDQKAIALLQATLARFPEDATVTEQLAALLAEHGRRGDAERLLQDFVQHHPDSASAYFNLGRVYLTENRPQEAITALRRASTLQPYDGRIAIALAEALRQQQGPTAALQSIQAFTAHHPGDLDAQRYLAALYLQVGGQEQAMRVLQKLTRDDSENPELWVSLGAVALQNSQWKVAQNALERARELAPQSPIPLYYLGLLAEAQARWNTALQYFQRIQDSALALELRLHIAQAEYRLGRREKALADLDSLAREHPDNAQIALFQAQLLADSGARAAARKVLQGALAKHPEDAGLWFEAGVQAELAKDYPAMEQAMTEVIRLKPDDAAAYNFLGYSLLERNQHLERAATLLQKALQLSPKDPAILDSVGWLFHRQGKDKEALPYLQEAWRQLHPDAEVGEHLGRVLWDLGRKTEARAIWREALRAHPDNATLKRALHQ